MRLQLFAAICLACTLTAWSAPIKFDSLKVGSTVYQNVTVLSANETDVYFSHEDGLANAKLKRLDAKTQKLLGYNPKVAERVERERIESEQDYKANVLATMVAAAAAKPPPARKLSPETALCDSVSDKSLIGKPGPQLDYKAWSGLEEAPSGKHVALLFWTGWSRPSREAFGQLVALEKKFRGQLILLGLNPDPTATVEDGAEVTPVFPTAADPEGKIANAAGATSVPFVLLLDPAGKVVYQGHPGALVEAKVAKLLAKTAE